MPPLDEQPEYLRLSQRVRALISWHMREKGISRAQLARDMNVTPGRVSQLLSGDENLTLKTLAAMTSCLGTRFEINLADETPVRAPRPAPAGMPAATRPRRLRTPG